MDSITPGTVFTLPRPSKECVNGMSFPVFDKEVKYFCSGSQAYERTLRIRPYRNSIYLWNREMIRVVTPKPFIKHLQVHEVIDIQG